MTNFNQEYWSLLQAIKEKRVAYNILRKDHDEDHHYRAVYRLVVDDLDELIKQHEVQDDPPTGLDS